MQQTVAHVNNSQIYIFNYPLPGPPPPDGPPPFPPPRYSRVYFEPDLFTFSPKSVLKLKKKEHEHECLGEFQVKIAFTRTR